MAKESTPLPELFDLNAGTQDFEERRKIFDKKI